MREYLNSEILALLPDELVEMLSPKKTIQIQNGATLECDDLLFYRPSTRFMERRFMQNTTG